MIWHSLPFRAHCLKKFDQDLDASQLPTKYYTFKENVNVSGIRRMVSKTGYTGEGGYELAVEMRMQLGCGSYYLLRVPKMD